MSTVCTPSSRVYQLVIHDDAMLANIFEYSPGLLRAVDRRSRRISGRRKDARIVYVRPFLENAESLRGAYASGFRPSRVTIHRAAREGRADVLHFIRSRADEFDYYFDSHSVLMMASRNGHTEILAMAMDRWGHPAQHMAFWNYLAAGAGQLALMRWLTEARGLRQRSILPAVAAAHENHWHIVEWTVQQISRRRSKRRAETSLEGEEKRIAMMTRKEM